jgi:hypothetical protein
MATGTVHLGRIGEMPVDSRDRRGQALHLPTRDIVVVIDQPDLGGAYLANRVLYGGVGDGLRQVRLAAADLERATETIDIGDLDTAPARFRYLNLWTLRVWQRRGSRDAEFCRLLAVKLLEPAWPLTVDLDDAARKTLFNAGRMTSFGFARILDRMVREGFLAPMPIESSADVYRITIPESEGV